MLISHVVTANARWQAKGPIEPDGTVLDLTAEDQERWEDEMMIAAACMLAIGRRPRRLVIFHPDMVA